MVGSIRSVARRIAHVLGAIGLALVTTGAADPSPTELQRAAAYLRATNLVADLRTPPIWLAGGHEFLFWDASASTWAIFDAHSGARRHLLGASHLQAELASVLGRASDLKGEPPATVLDAARSRLLFEADGQALALSLSATPHVTALAADDRLGRALLGRADSSPDGTAAARQMPGGVEIIRTDQGVLTLANEGELSWDLPERSWSPSGRHLAVWQSDTTGVHKVPVVDYLTPLEEVRFEPYAKAGTPLPKLKLFIVDRSTGARQVAQLPDEEGYGWLGGWRPDGSAALVMYLSRDGKRLTLYQVGLDGGTKRLVSDERPETFVAGLEFGAGGYRDQVAPLPDNRHFVWVSERDGWRHAYLYDYSGRMVRQLTRGAYPVGQIFAGADAADHMFVTAATDPKHPYERSLYRVPLRGGSMREVSRGVGSHQISFSPSRDHFIDGYSTITTPRTWAVASADGRSYRPFAKADATALQRFGYQPPEPFSVLAADGKTRLYGVLFKPDDFDPSKRYPVINQIYAGPWISIVPWGYVGALGIPTRMSVETHGLAQAGFVVMMLDNRGTPGRSKAFQDANYGRIGEIEIPDHVAALKQVAADRPYMDLDRVGIYGHSWGGYFALRGMLTAADIYKAGYAGAPGSLGEAAFINEPNMGLPSVNAAGYAAGLNMPLAANLKGALRIMHGTADVNATFSTTMRMADALIKAGKYFELMIMPGQPHGPIPPLDAYYLHDRIRFFRRELGEPR